MNQKKPNTVQAENIITNAMFRRAREGGYSPGIRILMAVHAIHYYTCGVPAIAACDRAWAENRDFICDHPKRFRALGRMAANYQLAH